ncbi:MAG: DNA methyltransferase, partial [Candidatus Woesearchaeota archaeon]
MDPFCGFGTFLIEAKKLGRETVGIEINKNKVNYSKNKILNIICENILKIDNINLPKIDLCITSPPFYLTETNLDRNKKDLSKQRNYKIYLKNLIKIFLEIKKSLKKNAKLVILIKNIYIKNKYYPLAWDLANNL